MQDALKIYKAMRGFSDIKSLITGLLGFIILTLFVPIIIAVLKQKIELIFLYIPYIAAFFIVITDIFNYTQESSFLKIMLLVPVKKNKLISTAFLMDLLLISAWIMFSVLIVVIVNTIFKTSINVLTYFFISLAIDIIVIIIANLFIIFYLYATYKRIFYNKNLSKLMFGFFSGAVVGVLLFFPYLVWLIPNKFNVSYNMGNITPNIDFVLLICIGTLIIYFLSNIVKKRLFENIEY